MRRATPLSLVLAGCLAVHGGCAHDRSSAQSSAGGLPEDPNLRGTERRAPRPTAYEQTYGDRGPDAGSDTATAAPRPEDTIYRDELMRATANGSAPYLLRALQPEVYRPNGRFIGWRIQSVWPDDPALCAQGCDLQEGDIILTINGLPVERPEQLSALLADLPTMETLAIQMIRGGKLRARSFEISDRP